MKSKVVLRLCPCVTPTAVFVVMPQMRRMLAIEAAGFQGIGPDDVSDVLVEAALLDYVGNAFATSVMSVVVSCTLAVWNRE